MTLRVPDQFEVEPLVSYTSSYVDRVMFGEMFVDSNTLRLGYTPFGVTGSFNSRRLLTSKVRRNPEPYFINAWMPGDLVDGYGSGSYAGRPQRFVRRFTDGEFFFDSFIPNPVDIHMRNGARLASAAVQYNQSLDSSLNEGSGSFYGVGKLSNTQLRSGFVQSYIRFAIYPIKAGSAILTSSIVDLTWSMTFPFQSRYKQIERLFSFSGRLPRDYSVTENPDGGTLTPASSSNQIGLMTIIANSDYNNENWISPLTNIRYPTSSWTNGAGYRIGTVKPQTLWTMYFGFGRGATNPSTAGFYPNQRFQRSIPEIRSSLLLANDDTVLPTSLIPRGWKYGLKSISPEQTSCVWRINRYGQFRDMLEQRPFSKVRILGNGGAVSTDGPVKFSFLSSSAIYSQSLDYVTATNPSYNPRDSGAWDVEYKSGHPFVDMDPLD